VTDELAAAIAVSLSSGAAGGAIGALVALLMRDRRPRRVERRAARRRPHADVAPACPVQPEVLVIEARPAQAALPASHTRFDIAARDWFDRGGPR
jgi:hypothetical protein